MVRSHHERWDGKGYPDRLTGEDIPLHARVLALADVFDALTTDRPYRPAFSPEEALRMMRVDMNGAFDPTLFPVFERLVPSIPGIRRGRGQPTRGQTGRGLTSVNWKLACFVTSQLP